MRWFLLLAPAAFAADWTAVERTLTEEMRSQGIPAASIVIVERGKAAFKKSFGDSVTVRTLFRIGSTAKVFTSLAAVKLADAGKLDLNAPIGKYAPAAPNFLHAITMRQLLSHTAGIAEDAPMDGPHDEAALARNVESWREDMLLAPPGKVFSYANPGYVLAGYVLEKVAGKPFADVVAENVFQPMGMESATYRPLEAITSPVAPPHAPGPKPLRAMPDHAGAWPPGSLFLSANDAERFLLTPLPQAILGPHADIAGDGRKYGFGVTLDADRVFHTGGRAGYGSRFEIYPRQEIAFFVMGNRTGAIFSRTAAEIRRQAGVAEAANTMQPLAVTPDEAARVTGRYANRSLRAELVVENGVLAVAAGARRIPVQRSGDWFLAPGGAQLERFRVVGEFLCAEVWCLKRQ